ncbi:MAG: cytochrome o ubiquinol oxidase operon protein cyoD [Candidatus Tokpelaia sp. JSC161]|jgi:cytochrome o ubiquinol oxidase operon protein cyoD|nr:MAG: cytochrome o ubiquinol oxidase operon protein cyoD [Candidatus Tokpelaia sp. JSC161]
MLRHKKNEIGLSNYLLGFVLSLFLTVLAFGSVMMGFLEDWSVSAKVIFLLGLAFIQMVVQIIFFLHINEGPDARWNLMSMWLSVCCVFIIVVGAWLTMRHLNYNMMGGSGRVIRSDVFLFLMPSVEKG